MGAQAFINSVGFPDQESHLIEMLDKNMDRRARFDAELLLWEDTGDTVVWTAPSWVLPGDVSFFYCTKNWSMRMRRLRRETVERFDWMVDGDPATSDDRAEFTKLLDSAAELHAQIAGTIFCIGRVIKDREVHTDRPTDSRLRDRIYAEIGKLWTPDPPLQEHMTRRYVAIAPRATISHVSAPAARSLVSELKHVCGDIPDWLEETRFGRLELQEISAANWKNYIVSNDYRVFSEGELRETFVDFLADLLACGQTWHRECRCRGALNARGLADYMVPFEDKWLPIEAKLRLTEPEALLSQVAVYLQAKAFTPTIGDARETISGETHSTGLVVDYDGIYAVEPDGFVECSPGRPLISRQDLVHSSDTEIRSAIHRVTTVHQPV